MKATSSSKTTYISPTKYSNDLFYLINKTRRDPSSYSSINSNSNDELIKLLKNRQPMPPLTYCQPLSLSTDEILQYYIFHEGLIPNQGLIDKKYSFEGRLKKYGIYQGFKSEIIEIFPLLTPPELLNHLLLNKSHRFNILNPYIKYIAISFDILPSGNYCVVIDLAQYYNENQFCYTKTTYKREYYPSYAIKDIVYVRTDEITPEDKKSGRVVKYLNRAYVTYDRSLNPKPFNMALPYSTLNKSNSNNTLNKVKKDKEILKSNIKGERLINEVNNKESVKMTNENFNMPKGVYSIKIGERLLKDEKGDDVLVYRRNVIFNDGTTLTEYLRK